MGASSSREKRWRFVREDVKATPVAISQTDSFWHSVLTPSLSPPKDECYVHTPGSILGSSLPSSTCESVLLPSLGQGKQVWEAVLWKRSRHLKAWRRRHLQLLDSGGLLKLTSRDATGRRTGSWELERSMPYIEIAPQGRFAMTMEVGGVSLAADSLSGAEAMEQLALIFNGRLMRAAQRGSGGRCSPFPSMGVVKEAPGNTCSCRSCCSTPSIRSPGMQVVCC
eukprot:TRINITY_DN15068_c0_g1_i3.p1 TRINITY_DN15068_c0_g1~~TRINITY_DN15068_c0_g1_i3.p1  ORF type:complete len:224 (+),score=31.28 TRINITY_DN15068_c0_g1_i3:24-695(+)